MRCWAEIDLDIIKENIQILKRIGSGKLMAVVKANAYGHGAVRISEVAEECGVDWLGVALVEEGIELRKVGTALPILVLSEPSSFEGLGEYGLTPVVYSKEFISQLPVGTPVHLKVDTGLHRVGCNPEDVPARINDIRLAGLQFQGIMTHLAGSDDRVQLSLFDKILGGLELTPPLVHAASSRATLGGYGKYDMDRCGISIYDMSLSLKSRVSFIRRVKAGEKISYGGNYLLEKDSYIAVVPIGYADGVPRGLVGFPVIVGGGLALIVSVTMDQLILDLGDVGVKTGTEVNLLVSEWAEYLNTISYEVYCGIRNRVPRIYKGV